MARSKHGNDDSEARARDAQRRAERHESGFMEFRCDECGFPFDEKEMKIQHGLRLCNSCYEPNGDTIDRDMKRAYASKFAAQLEANRKLPKYPFAHETAPWVEAFTPTCAVLIKGDIFDFDLADPVDFTVIGGRLNEVQFTFPLGVVINSTTFSADNTSVTFNLEASDTAISGDFPVVIDGSLYRSRIRISEYPVDPEITYLRLDGANNGSPLTWVDLTGLDAAVDAKLVDYVPKTFTLNTTGPLEGGGDFSASPLTLSVLAFGTAQSGVVPASGGGTVNFLRADGTWAVPPGVNTDLGYTAATRVLTSSNGADVTLPLLSSADAGLAPASGGGVLNFLRADGSWAAPAGTTNLGYTAATRILTSDTGSDVTLPLFSSTEAGLVAGSGGGTDNFLRADGTWALPPGASGGAVTSVFTRTGAVVATTGDYTVAQVTGAAPLASPTFTGVPAAPTAAVDTNTTQIATTAYVVGQSYLKSATAASTYAPLASPTFTGVPAAPTAAVDTNTTQLATTAYVVGQGYAKLASPTLTGTPAAPTAAVGTNTTQIATTAFVIAEPTRGLKTASNTVSVSAATAPTTGQVLKATAATTATWQSLAATDVANVVDTNTTQTVAGKKTFTKQYAASKYVVTFAASQTVDWDNGNVQEITMTGNITTLTLNNPISGGRYILKLVHSGGSRTVAWPASFKWPGGTAPTLSASGKTDLIALFYDGTNYHATPSLNF